MLFFSGESPTLNSSLKKKLCVSSSGLKLLSESSSKSRKLNLSSTLFSVKDGLFSGSELTIIGETFFHLKHKIGQILTLII